MQFTTAAIIFAASVFAGPISSPVKRASYPLDGRPVTPSDRFGLAGFMNHHNGPVPITAYNQSWHFAPGSSSKTFCPPGISCPNGTSLALSVGTNDGSLGVSMNDIVPGGQQVYVTLPSGQVKYTPAHEEGSEFGPGMDNEYLDHVTIDFEEFPSYNTFKHEGSATFYGCPTGDLAPDGSNDYVVSVRDGEGCATLTLIVLGDTTDVWQFE